MRPGSRSRRFTRPTSTRSRATICRRPTRCRTSSPHRTAVYAAAQLHDELPEPLGERGGEPCILSPNVSYSYRDLQQLVTRIANVLVGELSLVTGGRVLLRSANNPMMVATYLAVLKAGGMVVVGNPVCSPELSYPIRKAVAARCFFFFSNGNMFSMHLPIHLPTQPKCPPLQQSLSRLQVPACRSSGTATTTRSPSTPNSHGHGSRTAPPPPLAGPWRRRRRATGFFFFFFLHLLARICSSFNPTVPSSRCPSST